MDINFPLVLIILTALAGSMWFYDRLIARKRRAEGEPRAWYIEATAPFFPVLFVVLVLRSFVVEPFQIPSGSMIPTLKVGDFILVNKFAYGLHLPVLRTRVMPVGKPQRGDVMVFFPPKDKRYFIKRVIGLPGDEIRIIDNVLYVNGDKMAQSEVDYNTNSGYQVVNETLVSEALVNETRNEVTHLIRKRVPPGQFGRNFKDIVPEGHYYMIGDNRDNSHDSRAWGPVPEANIVGKAFVIWLHWDKFVSIPSFEGAGMIE